MAANMRYSVVSSKQTGKIRPVDFVKSLLAKAVDFFYAKCQDL